MPNGTFEPKSAEWPAWAQKWFPRAGALLHLLASVLIVLGVAEIVGAAAAKIMAVSAAVLGMIASWLYAQVTPKGRRTVITGMFLGVPLGLIMLAPGGGCASPYAVAWKTTAGVQAAGTHTDRALAAEAVKRQDKCKAEHGVKTAEFAGCYRAHRHALKTWRETVRPAVNTALLATVGALKVAEAAKRKLDWLALLKPAVCALARAVTEWGHLLGEKWKSDVMAGVKLAEGVSCD